MIDETGFKNTGEPVLIISLEARILKGNNSKPTTKNLRT
jgi:hypothetical protein